MPVLYSNCHFFFSSLAASWRCWLLGSRFHLHSENVHHGTFKICTVTGNHNGARLVAWCSPVFVQRTNVFQKSISPIRLITHARHITHDGKAAQELYHPPEPRALALLGWDEFDTAWEASDRDSLPYCNAKKRQIRRLDENYVSAEEGRLM